MSRIIETVKKVRGEMPDLIRMLAEVRDVDKEAPPRPTADNGARPQSAGATAVEPAEFRRVQLRVAAPSPLLPFEKGHARPCEQYRILRTKIVQHPKQPRMILVSSPAAGDGKSVTSINVAASLSLKSDTRVLLLDADLRNPSIHRQLSVPESPGLAEALRGTCSLEEAIVHSQEFPNLFVLTAGAPFQNPAELLDSPSWHAISDKVRSLFRFVVVDSPPIGAVADYDLIEAVCDGVIVIVRPDHTNRKLCERALSVVPKAKFLGVVLNCVSDWSLARHAGSDYYYSSDRIVEHSTAPDAKS